jgi:uncharacterized protein
VTTDAQDAQMRAVLKGYRRIAVVGMSARPERPSHGVARFLIAAGYDVTGINPHLAGSTVLGRPVYGALAELPEPPQIVDVFRRSVFVAEVMEQAIAAGAHVVWTQLGVRDDAAAERGRQAGLVVVQNRCTAIEFERLAISPAWR